jgi:hypothetical protein
MFHAPPEPENAKAPRWQSRGFAETNENQFRPPSDRPPAGRNQGVRIEEDDNPPVMQGRLGACRDPELDNFLSDYYRFCTKRERKGKRQRSNKLQWGHKRQSPTWWRP